MEPVAQRGNPTSLPCRQRGLPHVGSFVLKLVSVANRRHRRPADMECEMNRLALAATLPAALLLSGCSMTLPVRGNVIATGETFLGTATGFLDGAGTLTIRSSKGAVCEGRFVYVTRREGEGTATCSDGRAGPFRFVSTGTRGTGTGGFGRDRVVFTFGD